MGRSLVFGVATVRWRGYGFLTVEVGIKADVPGAYLGEEAALGLSGVEVAAAYGLGCPTRGTYYGRGRGTAVTDGPAP